MPGLADAVDEVVGAEVLVEGVSGEDVPDGDENRVLDGDERALLAPVVDQTPELGSEIGVFRAGRCRGSVAQDPLSQAPPWRVRPLVTLPALAQGRPARR